MELNLFNLIPYISTLITLIGFILLFRVTKAYLPRSHLKRIYQLYAPDDTPKRQARSLHQPYLLWLNKTLVHLGYVDKTKDFLSLLRNIAILSFIGGYSFLFFTGYPVWENFFYGVGFSLFSVLISHGILIFLKKQRSGTLAYELSAITGYVFDAIKGSDKSFHIALKNSMALATLLFVPLERFLNNKRTLGLDGAVEQFLIDVPIPEANDFMFLVKNGFEFHDRESVLNFIKAQDDSNFSLWMKILDRRETERSQLTWFLAVIPVAQFVAIAILSLYSYMGEVFTQVGF